ncbi:septum formation protein Maf [Candidatus Roizmanbacteria bacterium]|nr:septum formation protein Maf [Candidatus Roizmanbacteria bacterium]
MHTKPLILASSSPRRKLLLEQARLTFTIDTSTYKEDLSYSTDPFELVKFLSRKKAEDVATRHPNSIILGADTIIVWNGEIMGKPHTDEKAREMLSKLNNASHQVITGFTIINTETNKSISDAVSSTVYFKKLTRKQIEDYIVTGEPLDKAGAYAIQEGAKDFVERVEGDYDNVVGLPIKNVLVILDEFAI